MEFLVAALITVLPSALGGYFAYIMSRVRGYNVLLLTLLGVLLGPIVPAFIYFLKPKERLDHPWYPEELTFAAPALLRDPYSIKQGYSTPGHVYLDDDTLIWIPQIGDALSWDYAYAINAGSERTYKSEGLTWLLLPNERNANMPYAISLGTKSSISKLGMVALQNVLRNGDQALFDSILSDIRSKSRWLKGKKENE